MVAELSSDFLKALRQTHAEDVLLPVLVQLVIIILAARLGGILAKKVGQAAVVGEIFAGLVLGPSLLGRLGFIHNIFHPEIAGVPSEISGQVFRWIFSVLSELGLILILFLVGLEFDFGHLRRHGKSALLISVAGIALPFALGLAVAPLLLANPDLGHYPESIGPPPALGFTLFLGVALAITALPVLARILIDLRITRTRLATIAITGAAVNDAVGWILLAAIAAVVRSQFEPGRTVLMAGATLGFAAFMIFLARPALRSWARGLVGRNGISVNALAMVLCVVFICAMATSLIGIFAIFGAFLLGACLSQEVRFREAVADRLRDFVGAFFLPIFFTYTGLRTDIGFLDSPALWLLGGLVLAAAIVGKVAGCGFTARASGYRWREAGLIGIMMNTRGLMELIVVNVGYDLRVLPPSVYCMLVLMAIITTVMTTPLVKRLAAGTELEAAIYQRSARTRLL